MLLRHSEGNHLIDVADIVTLANPYELTVVGRYLWGEEVQDPEVFDKSRLRFLSGESLPRCWHDSRYRDREVRRVKCGTKADDSDYYQGA
ncbi:acetyltransferase [Microbulbifer agarilyticus]|uniref:acetyltransferase n=1 Tax=Microbulbifer agarilyticus TaxID=260552 RepID=UPI001C94F097|nr:acetyltransferase [Microbulbifer agarilyticus]MBY6189307.1 acetyltransferase [Microbulbifer agarilyticus]MBY6212401.1 acetyltransferase [Microbulbifer agarilyticus]MCA0894757.1 acetyltransferase [Microbulbifer agarilyticus]